MRSTSSNERLTKQHFKLPFCEPTLLVILNLLKENTEDNIDMIIIQHSAPKNYQKRMSNRLTWMQFTKK